MRLDLLLVNHPSQNFRGAVIGVTDQAVRFEIKAILDPLDHRLGRIDFVGLVGRGRLDVNHNARGNVDQVVRRIGVERRSPRGTPTRRRISQRDIFGRARLYFGLIQGRQIFAHRTTDRLLVRPVRLSAGHTPLTVGIRLYQAGIDGEPFTTHQPFPHATLQDLLKHETQRVAVTETAMPVLGERRVVRYLILQAQPTEPAIRQVQVDFLAEPAFRPDAEAVADDQHPNQQLRINRGSARMAVERGKVLVQLTQIEKLIDSP
jgi:hypothetical protein